MPIKNVVLSAVLLLFVASCSPFEAFEEMDNKQNEFNKLSFSELGAEAQISWHIENGGLVDVTVFYSPNSLNDIKVTDLEEKVLYMVKSIYGDEPYSISISIILSE